MTFSPFCIYHFSYPSLSGQGLSNHLQVPLPYLLYRAQVRYEEDLKGIQNVQSALLSQQSADIQRISDPKPIGRHSQPRYPATTRASISSLPTPTVKRGGGPLPLERRTSTQTLMETITSKPKAVSAPPIRSHSPTLSEGSESSSEEDVRADLEFRREEEQDALSKRLKELETLMTRDIGLVHEPKYSRPASVSSEPRSVRSLTLNVEKQSESSSTSPQGSIPSIPSPTSGSQSSSQILHPKRTLPPTTSPTLFSQGRSPKRYGHIKVRPGDKGSTQGSTASSFSDISGGPVSFLSMITDCRSVVSRSGRECVSLGKCPHDQHAPVSPVRRASSLECCPLTSNLGPLLHEHILVEGIALVPDAGPV